MEFSDFTIRLIIILIPGAIASLIVESLTIHKKWSHTRFIISSIILGGLTFCLLQLLYWLVQLLCAIFTGSFLAKSLNIWMCIFNNQSRLNPIEIVIGLILSIVIGYFFSFRTTTEIRFQACSIFKSFKEIWR